MKSKLNDPKVTRSWAMYDWANSVFSLTITTAIFPPFFESVSKKASELSGNVVDGIYYIDLFGFKIVHKNKNHYLILLIIISFLQ